MYKYLFINYWVREEHQLSTIRREYRRGDMISWNILILSEKDYRK